MGPIGEVTFDAVRVPTSQVLGEVNGGWAALDRAMDQALPVLYQYLGNPRYHKRLMADAEDL